MKLKFTKMHGCGNDYIYIDCIRENLEFDIEKTAKFLSNRHFGIGGDGIVLICRSQKADALMRMFNADGSEGKMCGNAIRCVLKYLYDNNLVKKKEMTIETLSGIKTLKATEKNGLIENVRVNMGMPDFKAANLPLETEEEEVVLKEIVVCGEKYRITCVSMGNPHAVVFLKGVENLDVNVLGAEFLKNKIFKEEVNVEFVEIISNNEIKMRVYERGSKETLACGTGACAVISSMVKNGYCNKKEEVLVHLLGGDLKISFEEDGVKMEGGATKVFDGEIEI